MRTGPKLFAACVLALLLAACAAGGIESGQAAHGGTLSLILLGLWHGIIAPVTLLVEIGHRLWPHTVPWTIRLYEVRANSVAYDVGFFLGLGGGPSFAWYRSRRD
ncbi:MAG TPA: hypothetical protein VGI30_14145 [Caulobacteraceae bacterium]|jgi:hypothetical protein